MVTHEQRAVLRNLRLLEELKAKQKGLILPSPSRRAHDEGGRIVPSTYFTPRLARIFEERFEALQAYKKEYGNCDVPSRYAKDRTLARWVKRIRGGYSPVDEERHARLTELGFVWEKKPRGAHFKSRMSEEEIIKAAKAFKPRPLQQEVSRRKPITYLRLLFSVKSCL